MDIYSFVDQIPLSFSRVRGNALVSGLTVTVTAVNAKTGASLLASTNVPEIAAGSGIYTYNWTHGIFTDVEVLVTFTVSGSKFTEFILITNDSSAGRAI